VDGCAGGGDCVRGGGATRVGKWGRGGGYIQVVGLFFYLLNTLNVVRREPKIGPRQI
jgi:hypothetical protein